MRSGFIVCVLVLLLVMASGIAVKPAHASNEDPLFQFDTADFDYENTPVNKLGRGIINAATCWAEVPGEWAEMSERTDPAVGATLGVVQGAITSIIRCAVGVFDTVTFLIPPYNNPEMKPEYAIESADQKIRDYLW
jgi:putative exosortase-associated protein (TIGR04073 family)